MEVLNGPVWRSRLDQCGGSGWFRLELNLRQMAESDLAELFELPFSLATLVVLFFLIDLYADLPIPKKIYLTSLF